MKVGDMLKHDVLPGTYAIVENIETEHIQINMFVMDLNNESISVRGIDLVYDNAIEVLVHWKLMNNNKHSKQLKLMLL